MKVVTVSSVSEGIAALQAFKGLYGDLPMLNEQGGPFQFSAIRWGEADHQLAGGSLQDGVSIDGVSVVISQAEDNLKKRVDNLYDRLWHVGEKLQVVRLYVIGANAEVEMHGEFDGVFGVTQIISDLSDEVFDIQNSIRECMNT